jgi:hypothetical protein
MSLENKRSLLNNNFRVAKTKSYINGVEKNYNSSVVRDLPKTKLKADIEDLPQVDPIIPTEVIEAIVEPVIEPDVVIEEDVPTDIEIPSEVINELSTKSIPIVKNSFTKDKITPSI